MNSAVISFIFVYCRWTGQATAWCHIQLDAADDTSCWRRNNHTPVGIRQLLYTNSHYNYECENQKNFRTSFEAYPTSTGNLLFVAFFFHRMYGYHLFLWLTFQVFYMMANWPDLMSILDVAKLLAHSGSQTNSGKVAARIVCAFKNQRKATIPWSLYTFDIKTQ